MRFRRGDRVICEGIQDKVDVTDCIGIVHREGVDSCHIKFDEKLSNGARFWYIDNDKMRLYTDEEYEEKLKRRKESSLRNIDKDPFQEEIWESNNFSNFRVGDRVICDGIQDGIDVTGCIGNIVSVHDCTCLVELDKKLINGYKTWYVDRKKLEKYDKKEYEEKLKRRKEASLRNIDKDPFQEEIWESNNFNNFRVGDRVIGIGIMTGMKINREIGTVIRVYDIHCEIEFDHPSIPTWFVYKERLRLLNSSSSKNREENKLKYKDVDPFGEEIWEHMKKFEQFMDQFDPLGVKKYIN